LLLVQFSKDTLRRDQIIAQVINTKYSHILKRREQALRKEAKSRLVAQKSRGESTISIIEVFKDKGYDISNLLNKTNISKEKHT
jgi:hypothetical protein